MPIKKDDFKVNKIPAASPDERREILVEIGAIYPALIQEDGSINEKELKALSEGYNKSESERYAFPWAGKTASKRFAFTPSKARLVPDKERSVDFDTTQNLIIEGENLEVLKLLQASYFKKVKMIYIDPPYNTGHDFVYPDDYSESKQTYWEKNGVYHDGVRMDTNTESSGRYHSNWLSMMQSRLLLARNLLRDDGVIFVSIDDNEVHNLRKLMDEVFGEENFVASIIWQKKQSPQNDSTYLSSMHDYVVLFAKRAKEYRGDEVGWSMNLLSRSDEQIERYQNTDDDSRGAWTSVDMTSNKTASQRPNLYYSIINPKSGKEIWPTKERVWRYSKEAMSKLIAEKRISWGTLGENFPRQKRFLSEVQSGVVPSTWWTREFAGDNQAAKRELRDLFPNGEEAFDTPKPVLLIKRMLEIASNNNDIVLDFFAGSGTTGHAIMQLNQEDGGERQYILIQLPEATDERNEASKAGYKTISQITIERVKRAGTKIKAGKPQVDTGFKVFRLARSLFPQNLFEINPDMTEEQKTKAWEEYLEKSKQAHLFDFKPDELLVEIALKDGFDLNFKAEPIKEFKKNKVLDVSDGEKAALICLDENIQEDTIKGLEPYKERRFICLERAVDTTSKWNLKRMFGENLWVA
ncbi:MAG: site-specific DNA-methyltransferase [Patescibacteria group bacterium]